VWQAGLSLAKFFVWTKVQSVGTAPIHGSRVLELGAGTGVLGLTLASQKARVTMTDFQLQTCRSMQCGINANNLASAADVRFLEWGDESSYLLQETFDLIVAADVLYETHGNAGSAALLAHTLQAHIAEGSRTIFFLAYRHRHKSSLSFFSMMTSAGFYVERLQDEAGRAVGSAPGQPTSVFDGSCFVELPPDVCCAALETAEFSQANQHFTQILRIGRIRPRE